MLNAIVGEKFFLPHCPFELIIRVKQIDLRYIFLYPKNHSTNGRGDK